MLRMKRVIAPILIVLLLGLFFGGWYFFYSRRLIASEVKNDWVRPFTYGYKLEQYRYHPGIKLTFWTEDKMQFVFERDWLGIDNVVETRWLPKNRAIYLHVNITHHDYDGDRAYPTKILYDFFGGQLYASSGLSLWRGVISEEPKAEKLMTEEEFQQTLSRLSQ